jgi:hypothetical protein
VRRQRSLAALLSLAAVEPDGLIVTTDARYVRLLECARPLQPLRGGRAHREAIREQLASLAARLIPGPPAVQRTFDVAGVSEQLPFVNVPRRVTPDAACDATPSQRRDAETLIKRDD